MPTETILLFVNFEFFFITLKIGDSFAKVLINCDMSPPYADNGVQELPKKS